MPFPDPALALSARQEAFRNHYYKKKGIIYNRDHVSFQGTWEWVNQHPGKDGDSQQEAKP